MLWQAYVRQLQRRPLVVKACTSGCTFTLTDLLAQWRERQKLGPAADARLDVVRTVRNGLFGLLWLGPTNHVLWARAPPGLEYFFPGASWRAVFLRVAVDQVTNMPLNMAVFLAWPALLGGEGVAASRCGRCVR
jgi:hypothetical protein